MAEIRAEITANVWQVVVEVGQMVAEGDEICILESMKMEIPVMAPEAGRVVKILVAEGAPVRDGQEVAVFEET
jgi:urea carboxylase